MAPRRFSLTSDTTYPKLDFEDEPGEDEDYEDVGVDDELRFVATNSSSGDNDRRRQSAMTMATKEDEDVRMFLALVDQMSLPSMLFLLQNHAREMLHTIPQQELQQVLDVVNNNGRTKSGRIVLSAGDSELLRRPEPIKQFRFAEIMGGSQIRLQVFEHLHVKDITEAEKAASWWNHEEKTKMKRNAAKCVRHYKRNRPDVVQIMEKLAILSSSSSSSTENNGKNQAAAVPAAGHALERLIKDFAKEGAPPRGLELHICSYIKDMRHRSINRVLDFQDSIGNRREFRRRRREQRKEKGSNDDKTNNIGAIIPAPEADVINRNWESIRDAYVQVNQASVQLAYHYAQADQMQAFKAILCKWSTYSKTTITEHSEVETGGEEANDCSSTTSDPSLPAAQTQEQKQQRQSPVPSHAASSSPSRGDFAIWDNNGAESYQLIQPHAEIGGTILC